MGFSAEELNAARQRLLNQVIEYFITRDGVEALYLQGSIAAGSTDEFSDIDFRVLIQPKFYKQYISNRFSAPQYWGEWLYNEWTDRAWVCVSHFKPFNKVDVLYFKPEELQPSPWFLLPTQILYDPKNLVREVVQASQGLNFNPDIAEIERLIGKGLAYAEEVYRRVMRDELFYAQSLLDSFREILMQFDDLCRNRPLGSASRFEQRGSKTLLKVLKLSYTALDKRAMLYSLGELLEVYRYQVVKLHRTPSLQRNQEVDLYWINTILELCRTNKVL